MYSPCYGANHGGGFIVPIWAIVVRARLSAGRLTSCPPSLTLDVSALWSASGPRQGNRPIHRAPSDIEPSSSLEQADVRRKRKEGFHGR